MNQEDWIAKSMDLRYGCRAEYGPLELRIETTASLNGFRIYVEDTRLEHPVVHEHLAQSTLESAKQSAVLRADEYLDRRFEAPRAAAKWRCS